MLLAALLHFILNQNELFFLLVRGRNLLLKNFHYSDDFILTGLTKPALTVEPQSSVFTGDSVTLRCEGIQSQNGWEFLWRKDSNTESTGAETKRINPVKVSDGGEYSCRARRGRYYTDYSKPAAVTIYGKYYGKHFITFIYYIILHFELLSLYRKTKTQSDH